MDSELLGLALPALGQVHQPGSSMHQFTKSRFLRVLLISISILGVLFSIFSWWVQTTFQIGNLDKKFDVVKIIHEVELQSGGYFVKGAENLFKTNQREKISTISLKQGRTTSSAISHGKPFDSVSVNVWKGINPKTPMMYHCRLSDTGDLIISRVYLEGAQ